MNMRDVVAVILGGGVGTRLFPLTRDRTKPAVPLAGKYRLIDIPMSNCFHAGIEKIAILTRDIFTRGWAQILAAEQTLRSGDWYQGTADAIRKQLHEIGQAGSKYVIILAGDHLYRMDYAKFVNFHVESEADVSIAVQPVNREAASALGILKMDDKGQISGFVEKPQTDEAIDGFESGADSEKPYMASMGIYVFGMDCLFDILTANPGKDFGKHIIPAAMQTHRIMGFPFDGYWEDIGTMRRFYEVNLNMAAPLPKFNLYDPERPIYTRPRFLPGSKVQGGSLHSVLLADGGRIQEATIRDSVVGLRSIIGERVTIQRTVVMGADYYETRSETQENERLGRPNIGIGSGSVIEGAIIDKNARIGEQVIIRQITDRPDEEHEHWVSREGIVIVPKDAIVPAGTVI
jgi:glucose-1-phosphate adenylyltransferase